MIEVDDRYAAYKAPPAVTPTETLAWNVYGTAVLADALAEE